MSERLDLTDPAQWSLRDRPGHDRMLLDPVSRMPLHPDMIPICVREEALLYQGVQYCADRAAQLRLHTVYTPHVTHSDLSMGWRGTWLERHVRRADYFGFEGFGYPMSGQEYYDGAVKRARQLQAGARLEPIVTEGVDRSGFYNRRARLIAATGSPTKCFPADVARLGGTPLEHAMVEAHTTFFKGNWEFESYAALYAIDAIREWIMLARLGLALREREGDARRPLRALTLFGRLHQDFTRKAQLLHIPCQTRVKGQADYALKDERIARTGIIPYADYQNAAKEK